jgi:ADP-ribose pyrophosphatase YjhB (NUDIX family)
MRPWSAQRQDAPSRRTGEGQRGHPGVNVIGATFCPPDRCVKGVAARVVVVAGRRIECVGAVVLDDTGRLLLVRRGREPGAGLWSIPGGKVEPGESRAEAVVRELAEETGLRVVVGEPVGTVERPAPGDDVFVIHDYRAAVEPGTDPGAARAGDDAAEVGWFTPQQVRAADCVHGLVEALTEWGVLAD